MRVTSTFESEIKLTKGMFTVDGKSILGIMSLAAAQGTVLAFSCDGSDAEAAMAAIEEWCRTFSERASERRLSQESDPLRHRSLSGYAIGRAHFVDRRRVKVPHTHLNELEVETEVERFRAGLAVSENQIAELKTQLQSAGDEHYLILDAHQLMLRDEMLVEGTCKLIRTQHLNAEWALQKVLRSIKQVFDNIDDEYFRERRSDVDFVGDRLLRNLLGKDQPTLDSMLPGSIVVAHDLSPADTAQILETSAAAFVTEVGGRTSHTAIMARSLELPAVVAVDGLTEYVGTGDLVVIDGANGRVHVNPSPDEVQRYQLRQASYNEERAKLDTGRMAPAISMDGQRIEVRGNIELPEEAPIVVEHGAQGVGLFRTEFLFMNRKSLPDEEEQLRRYLEVLNACAPEPATIRTLDLGGDKLSHIVKIEDENNPVMGLRAVRLCLKRPELMQAQARALLRASARPLTNHGPPGLTCQRNQSHEGRVFPLPGCTGCRRHRHGDQR